MRVVVAGGTGFIGRALVTALSERGDDVVVLTRAAGKCNAPGPRAECRRGAGRVECAAWSDAARVIEGAGAVVNLAGAGLMDARWTDERKRVLRGSRIDTTRSLALVIAEAKDRPRVFVSGSAVGYYGTKTGDRILTEEDEQGDDFLARLVADWERAADPAREVGARVCHPRTALVLGRGGGLMGRMVPAFKAFMGGPLGSGAQYVPWIHMVDAVRALEHAIDRADCAGPFNMVSPEPVTMNELARQLGEALDRPALLRVPAVALRLALGEAALVLLTGQRAVPKRLTGAGFAFVFPELGSALADLVGRPATS